MEEIRMLDAVERYIKGEMLPEERVFFEQLRKTNPAVDQLVVEHTSFLHQLNQYGERKEFKAELNEIHKDLFETGAIKEAAPAKLVFLWKKYKRVVMVAATIAGVTALSISGLISYVSPKVNINNEVYQILSRRLQNTERQLNSVTNKINEGRATPAVSYADFKSGGTGFLIDTKGYLVTNAHVVKNATKVVVQNSKGVYNARIIHLDPTSDLAFLKIEDENFKSYSSLPYGISRGNADLGEQIFTLGYPRDEIVYGEGYMSAKTGYEGDTLTCQIAVAANPGNSGGPVLNKNGEVVGILSARQLQAQGVVFAIRSKNIFRALDVMKNDSTLRNDSTLTPLKVPAFSSIKGMERSQQIRKIEDCIFIVKSN